MKTIQQNHRAGEMPVRKLMEQMKHLGAGTFFRGLSVPFWSYAVVNSVFFGAHKTLSKEMKLDLNARSPDEHFYYHLPDAQYIGLTASGTIAGICQAFPAIPVEVIKIRMQKDAHKGKNFDESFC